MATGRKGKGKPKSEQLESEDFHPDVGGRTVKATPPPKLEESVAFLYRHHPEAWCVMAGQVIPRLGKFKLRGGIDGVGQDPKTGRALPNSAIAEQREAGVVIIPSDVDGPGTTYLKRPKGAPHATLSKFELCYPGSTQIDCDEPGYVAWTRSLITRGVISPPPIYILQRMEQDLVKQVAELDDKRGVDHVRNRLVADLAGVRAELDLRTEAPSDTEPVEVDLG